MKKEKKSKISIKILVIFQIFLALSLVFTASYFLNETNKNSIVITNKVSKLEILGLILKAIGKLIFSENGLVSAESTVYTCPKSINGTICQEYPAAECKDKCSLPCIPTTRDKASTCSLGTCVDPLEGTCTAGSPMQACQDKGGKWYNDQFGNIAQCRRGCCFLGDNTQFVTEQQCGRQSSLLGLKKNFKAEINTELQCVLQSKTQEEGACVFESEFEKTCKFVTKTNCLTLEGNFHSGYLCSSPELGTNCKSQATTGCAKDKDGVYWFDSCGNRENIYDSNKAKSYNDGKILDLSKSCSLSSGGNQFANKNTCGNCNYLQGSRCGLKEDGDGIQGNSICKDLTCKQEDGKIRQNGESWCEYQGSIGVDESLKKDSEKVKQYNYQRATDPVGSRDFRKVCVDGEIRTDPCADYRNEICIQNDAKTAPGKTFSSAACRINRWQQCIELNTKLANKQNPSGITVEERDKKCSQNPDCFLKSVYVENTFSFNICAPKTPPGFDLSNVERGTGAQQICSFAKQTCTVVWVKDMGGTWECKANCECATKKFAEQMNDLCISLGDCGTKVNYAGDLTKNQKVFSGKTPKSGQKDKIELSPEYVNKLKTYSTVTKGKYIQAANLSEFYATLSEEAFGTATAPLDPAAALGMTNMLVGLGGIVLAYGVSSLGAAVIVPEGFSFVGASQLAGNAGLLAGSLTAAAGAVSGAAIGFATVMMLVQFSGIGPAIGEEGTYALAGAGAAAGAIIGANVALGGGFTGAGAGLATLGPGIAAVAGALMAIAWVLIIAIVIFILVEFLLGAGDTKMVKYTFDCQPWQAPLGGKKCDMCGKNDLPCSKYSCQSLGQTCNFINEGTGEEACVDISPNDVKEPVITPWKEVISPGAKYSEISENGFKIITNNTDSEGCVSSYQNLLFGLNISDGSKPEPAQCKYDIEHTDKYEDMEYPFGGTSLYLTNHVNVFQTPSIDSLGLPGYDPTRKAEYNLYVRCQDKSGNANQKEYNINFCVKPGIDNTPPIVIGREPSIEYAKANSTTLNASVFTNEPSDCKWSLLDTSYDLMNNSMQCDNSIDQQEVNGWRCNANFPAQEDASYFVRCKDQPWLIESNGTAQIVVANGSDANGRQIYNVIDSIYNKNRNAMSESYSFVIKKTSELKIDSLFPNNESLVYGTLPASVEIKVKTSGGINGESDCQYAVRSSSYLPLTGDIFLPPQQTEHSVTLQLFNGTHDLYVKCYDLAGNVVEKRGKFEVNIDTDVPKITRIYNSGNALNLITNENSVCSYVNFGDCNFALENGTIMEGSQLTHTGTFNSNSMYYIKCKDEYGNVPGGCSIMAKGIEISSKASGGGL